MIYLICGFYGVMYITHRPYLKIISMSTHIINLSVCYLSFLFFQNVYKHEPLKVLCLHISNIRFTGWEISPKLLNSQNIMILYHFYLWLHLYLALTYCFLVHSGQNSLLSYELAFALCILNYYVVYYLCRTL